MKALKFILILLLIRISILTQSASLNNDSLVWWSYHSAFLQPKGHLSFGLVQPLRYGLSERIELSVSPLIFALDPNICVKVRYMMKGDVIVTSEHRLQYPTPFLRLISAQGIGGIISPQYKMPAMGAMYNGILISYPVSKNSLLTLHTGFSFALRSAKPDPESTIDLPIVFPRLAVYYHPIVLDAGLDIERVFSKKLYGFLGTEFFIVPNTNENLFFEHRGDIRWMARRRFFLQGGYTLCYGRYPFGSQWHLLPNLDLGFRF